MGKNKRSIAAPKARNAIAQGNALGQAIQSDQALKARNQASAPNNSPPLGTGSD
jgi:hypothetical protein